MTKYEAMFIIKPDLEEDAYEAISTRFKELIETAGGEVTNLTLMGRRKLAYEVKKKFREGFYVLINYTAKPAVTAELERNFKISDEIIRYLIVKEED
ncbi:MAG: 30S ribosomal protein S6 [Firmicutes bacterium]|nr:30S ribosomal protein S6 [Bacillota bacterium]